jgi:aldehyde dehydrogenase (NAD+)
LSLYLFTRDTAVQQRVLAETSSGGATINDTMLHGATTFLPFGGVGNSGFGSYHGKSTFDAFTHHKSVMHRAFTPDFKIRYPPYHDAFTRLKTAFRLLG